MVILLLINKITFEKSENLEKKNSQKSEPCNRKKKKKKKLPWRKQYLKILRKFQANCIMKP